MINTNFLKFLEESRLLVATQRMQCELQNFSASAPKFCLKLVSLETYGSKRSRSFYKATTILEEIFVQTLWFREPIIFQYCSR